MSFELIRSIFFIGLLTLISGFSDSQGFLHAANIWHKGNIVWMELGKSALGFITGVISYWMVIKFLQEVGIILPEIQTVGWFTATIIGLALINGKFAKWQSVDQIVAILVVCGIGWLIFRVS